MTGMLLIALASLSFSSPAFQTAPTGYSTTASPTCTATVPGITFGIGSGTMCFHYDTTCDGTVDTITINASYSGPTSGSGTKTCTNASSCSYVLCTGYSKGTWTFTNNTTYTGGTSTATSTVTYNM